MTSPQSPFHLDSKPSTLAPKHNLSHRSHIILITPIHYMALVYLHEPLPSSILFLVPTATAFSISSILKE